MRCTCFGSSVIFLLLIGVTSANPTSSGRSRRVSNGDVKFRIVHTNDMHGRFEQTSQLSGTCSSSEAAENICYGGFARLATLIRNARSGSTPTLFLNAGDTYQGTVWFNVYKWRIVAKFLNILAPDAISLGNHEFDNGVGGLIPFINNVTFPVLAANLDLTNEPELQATRLAKSTVIDVSGTQVGIIGYLTPETKSIANTGNIIFVDEVEAVSKEAKRLKDSGVNILIALGHSGFTADKLIAAEVEDIDLVIGGHTNTFLYNGTHPDSEIPIGLYPTAVTQRSGRVVYVVQAYAYTKYLGNLTVSFDSEGELTHIEGNPVLVDSRIEQAPDVLAELENLRDGITSLSTTVVGNTRVLLNGGTQTCRSEECNMGNLITDALVDFYVNQYSGSDGWTDVAIAILNSGSIRTSISTHNDNKITRADVLAVLPFGNIASRVSMTGKKMLSMLEWGVHDLTGDLAEDLGGNFLQVSGIQVTYDLSKPPNSKVVSVLVRCTKCSVPAFYPLNETATYAVIINDFIHTGGDGFSMLSELESESSGTPLDEIVVDYLKKHSPVHPAVEWRITFRNATNTPTDTVSGASYVVHSMTILILSLLIGILK